MKFSESKFYVYFIEQKQIDKFNNNSSQNVWYVSLHKTTQQQLEHISQWQLKNPDE